MGQHCIFCDNSAGSREHLWPKWILSRGTYGPLRHQIRNSEAVTIRPEITVNTVCGRCNNGWMSALEAECIPVIGSMIQGLTVPLSEEQMRLVSVWATKTAMVMDSIKGRDAEKRFYSHHECEELRVHRNIPLETRVWLGHYEKKGLGGFGTDFTIMSPELQMLRVGWGMANTIVAGHLALQVVSVHRHPEHLQRDITDVQPKSSDWEGLLVQICPGVLQYTMWPPKMAFENKGKFGIGRLVERWRIGQKVDELPHL